MTDHLDPERRRACRRRVLELLRTNPSGLRWRDILWRGTT